MSEMIAAHETAEAAVAEIMSAAPDTPDNDRQLSDLRNIVNETRRVILELLRDLINKL